MDAGSLLIIFFAIFLVLRIWYWLAMVNRPFDDPEDEFVEQHRELKGTTHFLMRVIRFFINR